MRNSVLSILVLILAIAEVATARGTYQEPADFVAETFGSSTPETGAIWITEDRVDGRLLRYRSGRLETIVSGLKKPQGLAFDGPDWLYVAEQGRDRIIRVRQAN